MNNKTCILIPSLRGGGMEGRFLLLARKLVEQRWDVDMVLVNRLESAYQPAEQVRTINLDAAKIRHALGKLVRYLRTAKPDVLLAAETPLNVLAVIGRAITGYPRRLVLSERNHVSMVARYERRFFDRLRPLLVRWFYPKAELVLTVSRGVAEDLVRNCGLAQGSVQAIYNMFEVEEIIRQSHVRIDDAWLTAEAGPIIINIGRLCRQKDQAALLRAVAILRKRSDCRLLILGEGEQRRSLTELARELGISNAVRMPGFVSNPFAYLGAASVFALSSAWEGLPGALIEALACGTPVVSTDCPSGPAEILENGRYGTLTAVGDAPALADAILSTMEAPVAAGVLRERAWEFSVQRILPEYMRALVPHATDTVL